MSQFSDGGVSIPPGPALGGRKQGLSEMRCRGQLATEKREAIKRYRNGDRSLGF